MRHQASREPVVGTPLVVLGINSFQLFDAHCALCTLYFSGAVLMNRTVARCYVMTGWCNRMVINIDTVRTTVTLTWLFLATEPKYLSMLLVSLLSNEALQLVSTVGPMIR